MHKQHQPSFPAVSSTINTLDPSPSIGLNTRQFQYLEHQFFVALKVLAFKRHLVMSGIIIVLEQLVVFVRLRTYNIVN